MARIWTMAALIATATLAFADPAQAGHREKKDLTQTRPCGPNSIQGPLRYLFPQGFLGADFRPACRAHDHHYMTLNYGRQRADREFRDQLMCACESSRCKFACRLVARTMARLVDEHGEPMYQEGQRQAQSGI